MSKIFMPSTASLAAAREAVVLQAPARRSPRPLRRELLPVMIANLYVEVLRCVVHRLRATP